MNNKPVAHFYPEGEGCTVYDIQFAWKVTGTTEPIPLYIATQFHPAKEHFEDEPQAEELHEILQSNTHPADLTDEEINKLWAESHEDAIATQQGFTNQQHYFAHLILRKASEK